jgi:ribosomal protein S18 acetylase RimI-like enzyme
MSGAAERVDLRHVDDVNDVAACFALMRELRPHLSSVAEFVERWRRQTQAGYRLLAAWNDGTPVALAGYRIQENLVHGRFLYVDDLVTNRERRSRGHGELLMRYLFDRTRVEGCKRLVLDTPLDNVLGHRFYYRNGLVATALRFGIPLT